MISFINLRTLLLLPCLLLAAACQRQQGEMWRESDPTYVPFAVREIVVSANNRFVGLTVVEHENQAISAADLRLYLLDVKTGHHRLLGADGPLLPTVDDQFIYSESGRSPKPPELTRGLDTVRTFDIGEHNGAWWNSKTNMAVFETGWPQDREGFNILTLLKPATGTFVKLQVREPSELLSVCRATGNFYTQHQFPNDEVGADEYDSEGNFIRTLRSPLAVFSQNCRYVLPFDALGAHGPDDWAVFEASSGKKLMDFPWSEDGETDVHWFNSWNPRHDSLLLMYSTAAHNKGDSIDLFDVSKGNVVKSWPISDGSPPVRWSGDGQATVTIRDQHIVFEPLPAQR